MSSVFRNNLAVEKNKYDMFGGDKSNITDSGDEKKEPSNDDVIKEDHLLNTLEYTVMSCDTVASIAAQFDCTPSELCSLNKLFSRTVFKDMILKIPVRGTSESSKLSTTSLFKDDGVKKNVSSTNNIDKHFTSHVYQGNDAASHEHHTHADLWNIREASFVKMEVKYITTGEGFINGTLLVTSNSLMFDPNVSDSLVREHGVDRFVIQTPLENILSLAIYRDPQIMLLSSEKRKEESKKQLYNPIQLSTIYESLVPTEEVPVANPLKDVITSTATTDTVLEVPATASTTDILDEIYPTAVTSNRVDEFTSSAATMNTVVEVIPTTTTADTVEEVPKPATHIPRNKLSVNNKLSRLTQNVGNGSAEKAKHIQHSRLAKSVLNSNASRMRCKMACALTQEDCPIPQCDSWKDLLPRSATHFANEPLYLCICVAATHRRTKNASSSLSSSPFSSANLNKYRNADDCEAHSTKSEYWFSIPHEQADLLYSFLVDYGVNQYGNNDITAADLEARGFVMFNNEVLRENRHFSNHANCLIRCDSWEIINKEDFIQNCSFEISDHFLPLPPLYGESRLLVESRIRRLLRELPARAEGHSWHLMYSTEEHGFSLNSLYRRSHDLDAACLMLLKDNFGSTFGVVSSCPFKLCEHFYGTGETFLFRWLGPTEKEIFEKFSWSSTNNYIIKGDLKSLSIGCSQGSIALWLDDNLYHGRSQACDTFCNPSLTTEEDFVVCELEVWAFAD